MTRCLVNGKAYVGVHTCDHDDYIGSGTYFRRAVKKYGKKQFSREILQHYETQEELNVAERYWIKNLNTKVPHGYNLTDGGVGSLNPSEETRRKMSEHNGMRRPEIRERAIAVLQANRHRRTYGKASQETRHKMSEAHKGRIRKPHTEETKQKISKSRIGIPGSFLGRHHTEETRAKLRAAHLGKRLSPEARAKVSASLMGNTRTLGYVFSPECRKKMSARMAGNQRALGHRHTPEMRAHLSNAQRAAWARRRAT